MSASQLFIPGRPVLNISGQPAVAKAPPFSEEKEIIRIVFDKLGDLEDIELLFNDVLVIKYLRDKVSKNLVAAVETQREDRWQGVIGLVWKLGSTAFVDDTHTKFPKWDRPIQRGDWVLYRSSDGWDKNIRELDTYGHAECRILQDAHIRARVKYPGRII